MNKKARDKRIRKLLLIGIAVLICIFPIPYRGEHVLGYAAILYGYEREEVIVRMNHYGCDVYSYRLREKIRVLFFTVYDETDPGVNLVTL